MADFFRPLSQRVLADDWGKLTKHDYELRLGDGTWQRQTRETYDRGNGACCLLHNSEADTIVLTRQFRLPAFVNGHEGFLVEAPAGLLDGAAPAERMRHELEEETGFVIEALEHLYDVFMSPGSVTEYLAFFVGRYTASDRSGRGGGNASEGEDIAVMEVRLDDALGMIASGMICDAKTIILIQHLVLARRTATA